MTVVKEGTPIYFDIGNNVRFERMPDSMIQYNKKEAPKRNNSVLKKIKKKTFALNS